MNKIKKIGCKIACWNYFPFIVFFAVLFVFFLHVNIWFSDDAILSVTVRGQGIWETAWQMRQGWSSRVIIELVYFTLYCLPLVVWRVLNSLIYVLAAYSLARLAGVRHNSKMNWLACATVMLYPITEMINAGWISGSANYIWIVALGLYCITPWVDFLTGRPVSRLGRVLSLPALLYAANSEQMLALLGGGLALTLLYIVVRKHKLRLYYLLWISVYLLSVILILTAPGPSIRKIVEVKEYYPDFGLVHPLVKLYNCFILFSGHFIGAGSVTLLFGSGLLCLCVWLRNGDWFYRIVSAIPFGAALLFGPLYPASLQLFPNLERFGELEVSHYSATSGMAYVPFAVYGIVWATLIASAVVAFKDTRLCASMGIVLAAGLCSQLVLFLSPSIYYSVPRFYIHLHFALLTVGYFSLRELQSIEKHRLVNCSVAALGVISTMGLFLSA